MTTERKRKAPPWSQSELARRSGLAAPTVSQIESGRLRPYPIQLEKLAAALGWTGDPAALLEDVSADAAHA